MKDSKGALPISPAETLPGATFSRRQFSKLMAAALGALAAGGAETASTAGAGAPEPSDTLMPSVPHGLGPCWPREPGDVHVLCFGVQIPKDAAVIYRGTLLIRSQGGEAQLALSLRVSPQLLEDAGDSQLWRHSRLPWLDSTVAIDDVVTAPYTP